MSAPVTNDILEAYLLCKYKARLKLAAEPGTPSDYGLLAAARKDEVRRRAIDLIVSRHGADVVARGVRLTAAALTAGPLYVLNALYEEGSFSLRLDGLQRVDGPSQLGDFHYAPVLFDAGEHVRKEQRLLLEVYGLVLARLQGRRPASGIIWHGKDCRATRVRPAPEMRQAEKLSRDVQAVAAGEAPPLALNDHCPACEFRHRCHDHAVAEDNLTLLRGLSAKDVKRYARKGILTLTQLAHTFRPRARGRGLPRKAPCRNHALHALAVRDRRIYAFGTPELPEAAVRVYLDVEGVPDEGFVYLIGLTVVEGNAVKQFSFWADDKEQEPAIFEQFLTEVSRHDDARVFCYGSYERAFLKRMRKAARRKGPVDRVLKSLVNVLSVVYAHLYFPCYSNGLKEVAGCLGCSWSAPDASGLQSLVWRARWEVSRAEEWKDKLLAYNREDCEALRRVTELLYAAGSQGATTAPPVTRVPEVARWDDHRTWQKAKFANPDFAQVNGCAYFDYQREKVYIRTSEALRKRRRKARKGCKQRHRATHHVVLSARKCPRCGSTALTAELGSLGPRCPVPRRKRAYDLRVTASGIKRKVIECRTSVHRCLACGHDFIPEAHDRLDKHFHGLKAWVMYQHVAHRVSLEGVADMLGEFFGLRVRACEVHMFKALMARYYRSTGRALLRKLLAGPLLHIDETEVRLRGGKGYVWVFTNLEEVVYLYRPTREGDFLKEMLKDFRGVLVTDFYGAYDSLDCPQQKCLIHLIRDMNQELLNNPFDEELKAIINPFGALLRATVATIDEHGLKRRHLSRHSADVEAFFARLSGATYRSEAAEALRARLLKYRDKLFTFIEHDGVPWNNNNAEHAIKRFAYYREQAEGMLRANGLGHYLTLLSLCETCRYKGISFLRFLVSGVRDVETFCQKRYARRRFPAVQVYPKGFTPPHHVSRDKARLHREGLTAGEEAEHHRAKAGGTT